ncbi:MAG: antitoxin family protein [Methanotrichaceae archaeon]
MDKVIDCIYESGVFKPLRKVTITLQKIAITT